MKNNLKVVFGICALALAVTAGVLLHGQTLGINPTVALAGCQAPQAGWLYFCQVANDTANPAGAYVSANGAAYFRLTAASSGVASFNNRTGNVLPLSGDYSFNLISGQFTASQMPSSLTCTFTGTVGTTNKITLTGCQ